MIRSRDEARLAIVQRDERAPIGRRDRTWTHAAEGSTLRLAKQVAPMSDAYRSILADQNLTELRGSMSARRAIRGVLVVLLALVAWAVVAAMVGAR
jgi:hypothetical protein